MLYIGDVELHIGMVSTGSVCNSTVLVIVVLCGILHCSGSADASSTLTMDVLKGAAVLKVSYRTYYMANADGEKVYVEPSVKEIKGFYSIVGSLEDTHGKPQQIHPLSCDDLVDDNIERPWVAIIFLEVPNITASSECGHVYNLTTRAAHRGASAVILDIRDNQIAAKQLSLSSPLGIPIILVEGDQSLHLRQIIKDSNLSSATIYISQGEIAPEPRASTKLMVIVAMVLFIVIGCVIMGAFIRMKCYHGNREPSMSAVAKGILSKMVTRKFAFLDMSCESEVETCAVCLEDYKEGQELRTVPCGHEFHKVCVDPWLIANRTCPLCMYNITERTNDAEGSLCSSPTGRIRPSTLLPPSGSLLAPTLPRQTNNYYSPLNNAYHMYHNSTAVPYSSIYHPLYTSAVDHRVTATNRLLNSGPPVYRGLCPQPITTSPSGQYTDCNMYHYNVLPVGPSQASKELMLRQQTSPLEFEPPDHFLALASESVQTNVCTRTDVRNKCPPATYSNSRRRPPGRHKNASSQAYRQRSHLSASSHHRGGDLPASSSESEFEVRLNRSRQRLQRYPSSQFDADVSEMSTGAGSGMDSDAPTHSDASQHDLLSTRSVFGSSEVPTDISSCDSNIYSCIKDVQGENATSLGVHLQPACMLTTTTSNSSKKISALARKRHNSKPAPYSVISSTTSKHRTLTNGSVFNSYVPSNPPGSLEDSDQTFSSVDTTNLSPHISGWSQSSDSETNVLPPSSSSPSHNPTSLFLESSVCPLCRGSSTKFTPASLTRHKHASHSRHRSDPAATPLLAADKYKSQNSATAVLSSPYAVGTTARVPHKIYPPHLLTQAWEKSTSAPSEALVTDSLAKYSHGSVSKAGSTCSFYCYPSNQHSSSASSSPMHHPKDSHQMGLVVHSQHTGDVSTSPLGYPYLFPGNIV